MSPVFIDTNVPMYAAGATHRLRASAQQVIRTVAAGELDAVTDAEVLQEILYRYFFIREREKGFQVFDGFRRVMLGRIFPIADDDVQRARELAETYAVLGPRDLIHLAVMERSGTAEIITADQAFDGIGGIRRIDLTEFATP